MCLVGDPRPVTIQWETPLRAFALTAFAALAGLISISPGDQSSPERDVARGTAPGVVPGRPAHDWSPWGRDDAHNAVSPEQNVTLDFQFPMPHEDGTTKQPARNIAWRASLGSRTVVPPVIADGLVWCCSNARQATLFGVPLPSRMWDGGVLLCFRESDGALLWRHCSGRIRKGNWVEDFAQSSLGSVPYLDGDRLWYMNNRNEVVCFDISPLKAGTGEPRKIGCLDTRKVLGVFAHKPLMSGGMAASIAGDADRLYIVTHNGVDEGHINVPSPKAPSLICLDKKSGRLLWSDNSPGKDILHVQISSPLACEVGGRKQVVVAQGDGWLRSFEAETGKLLWKCDLNPKESVYDLGGGSDRNYVVATPTLYDNRIYVPTGRDVEHGAGPGGLYCIDPTKDGDISRELQDGPKKGKPNPNSAVVWYTPPDVPDDAPRIMVGNKKPRDLLRSRDFYFCRSFAGVTAHDGLVYAADIMGYVYCFDAKTGKLHWADDTKDSVSGQPLWVDGKLFVGTWGGDVFAYAHGKAMKRLAKLECDEQIRTGLVYANRTLFVTTDQRLIAVRDTK